MERLFYAFLMASAFATTATAASVTNTDSQTVVLVVVEDGKRVEIELQPGDQQTICASGCFVTLPDGDRIGLEGGENVEIVNGSAVVK
ncbi:hypothetical protein MRS76_16810 [Rhizobiaceae bacterium n13]|uniref:Uncharacterized protein n=1 Tax=Ferirhizobium litorale TaxID=2927786 RepID=A0AAE3QGC9_9HYPH|nr:hypothetical protein [Fererhizobium litorale]MDI7863619.1 hypothetical protein [Fererhizobium litorale]MDI7923460.1 hypothetical protein [Fererhizobium litorale]